VAAMIANTKRLSQSILNSPSIARSLDGFRSTASEAELMAGMGRSRSRQLWVDTGRDD
jgi:hypothetical protein